MAGSNKGAVSLSGSAVHVVRAAKPVSLRAAASGAGCLIWSTLPGKKMHFYYFFLKIFDYLRG
jgi:hypothetical protein